MTAEISPRITTQGRTKLETVIPLSTPYLVFLDPSSICNAQCEWCPTGSGEQQKYYKPQLMDYILYRKIINDLCSMPEPIKTLRLYSDGEPFLNPMLPEMIAFAKRTGRFRQIDTTTNGSRLTCDVVDAGLDKIFISVPQSYNKEYMQRIKLFYEYAKGKCHVLVKIIGTGLNKRQRDSFMRNFQGMCDSIFIENLVPCWPDFEVKNTGEIGIYGQEAKEVEVCPYIFYSTKINSDGLVSLCFLDWKHEMIIGDLNIESFKDIWNSPFLRIIQRSYLLKLRTIMDSLPCCNCQQLKYGAPDDIDEFATEILKRL